MLADLGANNLASSVSLHTWQPQHLGISTTGSVQRVHTKQAEAAHPQDVLFSLLDVSSGGTVWNFLLLYLSIVFSVGAGDSFP